MSGRAYKIVLDCLKGYKYKHERYSGALSEREGKVFSSNITEALSFLSLSLDPYVKEKHPNLPAFLNTLFDIDKIIEFSGGWEYWLNLPALLEHQVQEKNALNQQLFSGTHHKSKAYYKGIEDLAKSNVRKVSDIITALLPKSQLSSLCDLGAGPAVYSNEFVRKKIVKKAVAVDLPYVVDLYRSESTDRMEWLALDISQENFVLPEKYEIIYLGNVLHHYGLQVIRKILHNIYPAIKNGGYLVIQDYILWPEPVRSRLYAAILGLHFALTTNGGRCCSNVELMSEVTSYMPKMKFYNHTNLETTDLMIFQKTGRQ